MVSCEKNNDAKKALDLGEYEADYGEIAEKYADMKFETCADAIAAGNEIASVYYATADKAFKENDAKAKSDLENFSELLSAYNHVLDSMRWKCPEDFDRWEKDNRRRMDSISYKVGRMFYNSPMDTAWGEDISSEIEAVNEQVEQLMIDIQQFAEQDDSINGLK
jgi:hypothetical protein